MFYYLYSADYKFLKAILKNKFDFVSVLFGKDISRLLDKKVYRDLLEKLYGKKSLEKADRIFGDNQYKYKNDKKQSKKNFNLILHAYTVPITSRSTNING